MISEDSTASAVSRDFTVAVLRQIRTVVADAARRAGLTEDANDNLVAAVTEIANNTIAHGGGCGHLHVRADSGGIDVQISDRGPGLPDGFSESRPDIGATSCRGPWLARRMGPNITFVGSPHGLTVRLTVDLP